MSKSPFLISENKSINSVLQTRKRQTSKKHVSIFQDQIWTWFKNTFNKMTSIKSKKYAYSHAAPFASHACKTLRRPTCLFTKLTLGIGREVAFSPVMVLNNFRLNNNSVKQESCHFNLLKNNKEILVAQSKNNVRK